MRVTAITKWFNDSKGIGFLTTQDGKFKGKDIFCHYTSLVDEGFKTLAEGDLVSLEVLETERGLQAGNVEKLKGDK